MSVDVDPRRLLTEYASGLSYREIGSLHSISHETARKIIGQEAVDFVVGLQMSLLLAQFDERRGLDDVVWPMFPIVTTNQQDLDYTTSMFRYAVAQLRDAGMADLEITPYLHPSGRQVAFMLTLPKEEE